MRSQTSTEYLIITAVVIIIAVIVIGVLGGIPGVGSGSDNRVTKLALSTATIAVTSYAVSDYDTSLTFQNNHVNTVILDNITVNGEKCSFFYGTTHKIKPGQSLDITCQNVYELDDDQISWSVAITWSDFKTGATYIQNDADLVIEGQVANKYMNVLLSNQYWNGTSGLGCYDNSSTIIPICTCDDLNRTRYNINKNHVLQNSIDFVRCLNEFNLDFISGTGWIPICQETIDTICSSQSFSATFDGQENVIKNLFVNSATDESGFFGDINNDNANIINLGLVDVDVQGAQSTGGLAGYTNGNYPSIENTYVTGSINSSGSEVGGLVGIGYYVTITNSYASVNVSAGSDPNVGGLVGDAGYATITNSYSEGSVVGSFFVGGLLGYASGTVISNSHTTSTVMCTGTQQCGGFVGESGLATVTSGTWVNYTFDNATGCSGQSSVFAGISVVGCTP